MKALLATIVALAVLAVASTSSAAVSPQACAKKTKPACPTLTTSVSSVQAGETFTLTGANFHKSADATLSFSAYGQPPYYTLAIQTLENGTVTRSVAFTACAADGPVLITLTLTDSYGSSASAQVTLC